MRSLPKFIRTFALAAAVGGLVAVGGTAGAFAQAANPCAPKAGNPCAPKPANPCAPKAGNPCTPKQDTQKPANPCAPKAGNPCAPKK